MEDEADEEEADEEVGEEEEVEAAPPSSFVFPFCCVFTLDCNNPNRWRYRFNLRYNSSKPKDPNPTYRHRNEWIFVHVGNG